MREQKVDGPLTDPEQTPQEKPVSPCVSQQTVSSEPPAVKALAQLGDLHSILTGPNLEARGIAIRAILKLVREGEPQELEPVLRALQNLQLLSEKQVQALLRKLSNDPTALQEALQRDLESLAGGRPEGRRSPRRTPVAPPPAPSSTPRPPAPDETVWRRREDDEVRTQPTGGKRALIVEGEYTPTQIDPVEIQEEHLPTDRAAECRAAEAHNEAVVAAIRCELDDSSLLADVPTGENGAPFIKLLSPIEMRARAQQELRARRADVSDPLDHLLNASDQAVSRKAS